MGNIRILIMLAGEIASNTHSQASGIINVQIIDCGHIGFPEGLIALLEEDIQFVETKDNEVEALNYSEEHKPDVILLNYHLREYQTLEFIVFLLKTTPRSKVIVIGDDLSDDLIFNCLMSGASGYLKLADLENYVNRAVRAVNDGEAWITRRMVGVLLDSFRQRKSFIQ